MFTRSGKRIRENYLEDEMPKTTRKTCRKRQKENETNKNTDRVSFSISPKNNAENANKTCDPPKRTLRSKSINVLIADSVSKLPKISNTKKNKRKNVVEMNGGNETEKSTQGIKKAKMSTATLDMNMDSMQKADNVFLDIVVKVDHKIDNDLKTEKDLEKEIDLKKDSITSVDAFASAAGDTYILDDKNMTKTTARDDVSDNFIDSQSYSNFKSNITFNASVGKSFSFKNNSFNKTCDKLLTVEAEIKGPDSINRTFDITVIESLDKRSCSSRLSTEDSVSSLLNDNSLENKEKYEVTHSHTLHSTTNNSADSSQIKINPDSIDQPDPKFDQPDSKSEADRSLVRQNTFTKEDKVCPQKTEASSNIRESNMCLESVANRTRSLERNITPAAISSVVTPLMTSINILSSKAGAGRKRSRTEGATPLTPHTPAAGGRGSGTSMGSSVRPVRTQLPDFAALHRRRFAKMESLDEHQQRRADRARRLLQQRPARTPGDPPRKTEAKARTAAYNRFGFKVRSEAIAPAPIASSAIVAAAVEFAVVAPAAVAPEMVSQGSRGCTRVMRDAIARPAVMPAALAPDAVSQSCRGRVRVVREARSRCRSLLRGVRTNRRFELLMQARRAAL